MQFYKTTDVARMLDIRENTLWVWLKRLKIEQRKSDDGDKRVRWIREDDVARIKAHLRPIKSKRR